MKRHIIYFLAILMISTFSSCSKDDECDPNDKESTCYAGVVNDQFFTMKINGAEWKAGGPAHLFFVESPNLEINEDTGEQFYRVEFVGLTGERNGITIELHLTPEQFANPKGTYPVYADPRKVLTAKVSSVWVYDISGLQGEYASLFAESLDDDTPLMPDVGQLTITDFELGDSKAGMQKRLYRVKGTFAASTIYGFDLNGFNGKTTAITEGKFNLINALYQQ